MSTLEQLKANARSAITQHWASCEEGGLPHRAANRDQVLAAFDTFFDALSATEKPGEVFVLDAIRKLYEALHAVNAESDNGLLETDERELLVPFVIDAAVAVGLNPDDYDGEPGGEFRDF
jgi:hypothetical protein